MTSTWDRITDRVGRTFHAPAAGDGGGWGQDDSQSARDSGWDERGAVSLRSRERPRGLSASLPATRQPGRRYGQPGHGGAGGGGWDGRGRRARRKGDWWRRWTWKKALAVVVSAGGVFVILCALAIGVAYAKTPIPTQFQQAALNQASTVYFNDGKTVIGKFGSTDRQVLSYQQIPPLVRNAVVAAEDKNFWHEGGISPTGIVRAAWYDVTSSDGNLQGGSTITQQLVRNYYQGIGTEQTLSRKIKEIFVAEKLAKSKSKEWILTTYLNTVYFGNGAYGIGAAAQTYFGVAPTQLDKLTPAQAAMIAAMIQSPSYYSPDPKAGARYQGLLFRWKYVLNSMADIGAITQQQEAKALHKFPTVIKQSNLNWSGYRGYLMNRVRYELETVYGYSWAQIENDGLRITTTVSERLMQSLRASVRRNQTLMKRNEPPTGIASGVTPDGLPKYVNVGALLEQPNTGAILAMYSGPNYTHHKFDNALQSRNQVGSSFKPYVLATAVKEGMNVQTSRLNGWSPLWIPPDSQPRTFARLAKPGNATSWYQVSNDEVSNPNHPVSVVDATALSLNTAYTDLWHRVALGPDGEHEVTSMAKAFGVDVGPYKSGGSGLVTMEDQSGTALGQASLTVAEQASMIATLADMGTYHTQHMIEKIVSTTVAGTTQTTQAKVDTRQVLTPSEAADVDYAMSFDTTGEGTAAGLGLTNGQTVIAKTGTTNLAQSAFFLGATQRDAMAIGMFVNKSGCPPRLEQICKSTQSLSYAPPHGLQTLFGVGGLAGYGGQWPALIWHDFFMKNFNSQTPQPWPGPNNDGTAWNLVGPFTRTKPKPHHEHQPGGGQHCHQHGPLRFLCHQHGPTPTPTTSPSIAPTPTPTTTCGGPFSCPSSTPTPSHGGATAAAKAVAAGAAAGLPLALLLVVIAGPSLPLLRRLRPRRGRAPGR
jgi:membrane peptidoglycan carboxypeptidase